MVRGPLFQRAIPAASFEHKQSGVAELNVATRLPYSLFLEKEYNWYPSPYVTDLHAITVNASMRTPSLGERVSRVTQSSIWDCMK
jgi:hypothetical protein